MHVKKTSERTITIITTQTRCGIVTRRKIMMMSNYG